jgi:hypothetical protein
MTAEKRRKNIWKRMNDALQLFSEERDIVLKAYGGEITVKASVWGPWAIHKALIDISDVSDRKVAEMEGMWELTHWRSGWRVGWDRYRETLAFLAEMLSGMSGWESDDINALPISESRQILKEWTELEVEDV